MISVIIPSYNRAHIIKRSINSVLNQTYKDLEVIVVDDGSTDNTKEVVTSILDERVRYIYQDNAGACAARNNGIHRAKGEYIAFQDSDDVWRETKLSEQLYFLESYDFDVCFCQVERHGYINSESIYPILKQGEVAYNTLIMSSLVSTQTILGKKEVFDKHQFDISVKRRQDYDLVIRCARDFKFGFLEKVLVDLYIQEDSITKQEYHKSAEIYEMFLNKYKYICDDNVDFYIMLLHNIVNFKVLNKDYKSAKKYLKEANKIKINKNSIKLALKTGFPTRYFFCIKNKIFKHQI